MNLDPSSLYGTAYYSPQDDDTSDIDPETGKPRKKKNLLAGTSDASASTEPTNDVPENHVLSPATQPPTSIGATPTNGATLDQTPLAKARALIGELEQPEPDFESQADDTLRKQGYQRQVPNRGGFLGFLAKAGKVVEGLDARINRGENVNIFDILHRYKYNIDDSQKYDAMKSDLVHGYKDEYNEKRQSLLQKFGIEEKADQLSQVPDERTYTTQKRAQDLRAGEAGIANTTAETDLKSASAEKARAEASAGPKPQETGTESTETNANADAQSAWDAKNTAYTDLKKQAETEKSYLDDRRKERSALVAKQTEEHNKDRKAEYASQIAQVDADMAAHQKTFDAYNGRLGSENPGTRPADKITRTSKKTFDTPGTATAGQYPKMSAENYATLGETFDKHVKNGGDAEQLATLIGKRLGPDAESYIRRRFNLPKK